MSTPAKRGPRRHGDAVAAPPETSELSVEAPPSRAARLARWLLSGLKALFAVAVVLGAAGAVAFGAYRYALQTPRFALRVVEVEGNRRLTEENVLERAGVARGQNLFRIDLAEAERGLLGDPWIAAARVRRTLPSTLRVEVEERDAVALAAAGERLYLLARDGTPFKEVTDGDPYDLPVVTGIAAEALARDRARELGRVAVALELLRHWEQLPAARVHAAQEIHLGEDGTVTFTVGRAGTALALGKGPWRRKLIMGARILGSLSAKGQTAGMVFLDNEAHPERVVVRLR